MSKRDKTLCSKWLWPIFFKLQCSYYWHPLFILAIYVLANTFHKLLYFGYSNCLGPNYLSKSMTCRVHNSTHTKSRCIQNLLQPWKPWTNEILINLFISTSTGSCHNICPTLKCCCIRKCVQCEKSLCI